MKTKNVSASQPVGRAAGPELLGDVLTQLLRARGLIQSPQPDAGANHGTRSRWTDDRSRESAGRGSRT